MSQLSFALFIIWLAGGWIGFGIGYVLGERAGRKEM
jgi:hypothetical protein